MMPTDMAEHVVEEFERGALSRRQLASRLLGIGAAMAVGGGAAAAEGAARQERSDGTFTATGLDHVALNVSDIRRSRDFYVKHLGLTVVREDETYCFLGYRRDTFILALFQREPAGLNHYCYRIGDYDPAEAVRVLQAEGLEVRREQDRVYFQDPDGIEVQITGD